MNERIRLLAEQAEIKFESHPQHQGVDTAVIIPSDLKKFAELILKKCMEMFEDAKVNQEDDVDYGLEEAKNIIKEHFGVES